MTNQTISMDKKYETRDGKAVRILCTDFKQEYSVIGIFSDSNGNEGMSCWLPNGKVDMHGKEYPMDLVEVDEFSAFRKLEKYTPVYVRNTIGNIWQLGYWIGFDEDSSYPFKAIFYEGGKIYGWKFCSIEIPKLQSEPE